VKKLVAINEKKLIPPWYTEPKKNHRGKGGAGCTYSGQFCPNRRKTMRYLNESQKFLDKLKNDQKYMLFTETYPKTNFYLLIFTYFRYTSSTGICCFGNL